jgi:hypothetical protein
LSDNIEEHAVKVLCRLSTIIKIVTGATGAGLLVGCSSAH